MATVGNTNTPGAGGNFFFQGVNTPPNQVATLFTMPSPGGLITDLNAYFSTEANGTATCWLMLWDGAGNILADPAVSVAQGSNSLGGQAWHSASITPVYVAAGASIFIGFSVPQHNGFVTSTESSGSSLWNTTASPPAGFTGNSSTGFHAIGAYADFTPLTARVRRSGVWVATGSVFVRRSGVWTQATRLRVRRSGVWVDAT